MSINKETVKKGFNAVIEGSKAGLQEGVRSAVKNLVSGASIYQPLTNVYSSNELGDLHKEFMNSLSRKPARESPVPFGRESGAASPVPFLGAASPTRLRLLGASGAASPIPFLRATPPPESKKPFVVFAKDPSKNFNLPHDLYVFFDAAKKMSYAATKAREAAISEEKLLNSVKNNEKDILEKASAAITAEDLSSKALELAAAAHIKLIEVSEPTSHHIYKERGKYTSLYGRHAAKRHTAIRTEISPGNNLLEDKCSLRTKQAKQEATLSEIISERTIKTLNYKLKPTVVKSAHQELQGGKRKIKTYKYPNKRVYKPYPKNKTRKYYH